MTRIKEISLFVFFFFALISIPCHAQLQIHYGPRIGLGLSTFAGPDAHATNFPVGTIVGLYTHTDLAKKLSVDVELTYLSSGSLFTANQNTPEQRDYKVSLGYIALPVNLNYCVYKHIHLQLGIQTAAILTAVTEERYHKVLTKSKNINDYHAIDVGPTIGCYYQFEKGLQLGLRYYRGIQNIMKEDYQLYNQYFQFLLTYQFSKADKEL